MFFSPNLVNDAAGKLGLPGAGLVTTVLGSVFGGGGPTGDTHVQRTLEAAPGSVLQRTLLVQAWTHVQQARAGTIPDGPLWVSRWSELRQRGNAALQQLMNDVSGETGTPSLTTLPAPVASGGFLDRVLAAVGLAPAQQQQLAVTAGGAAGQQAGKEVGRALVLIVLVVVGFLLLKKFLK